MNSIHDVLEICLQEVENGTEVETVLLRYPELAEELRPILQASVNAQRMAVSAPSAEVMRRNRAKLLQHAALLREERRRPSSSFPSLQKWAMALAFLVLSFFTGTSLVRASSASLPGDSLYTVKRSWEDFTLSLTFDVKEREALEVEYENERLEELNELFASGRAAQVDFAGNVQRENGDAWWVSNILVIVSDEIVLPGRPIQAGVAVRVYGTTRGDGIVLAERIELLPAGAPLPKVEGSRSEAQPAHENSGPGMENEAPEFDGTQTSASTATPKNESITGTLTSINQDVWKIDDTSVDVGHAEIKGIPVVGAFIKAEGYFGADGVFMAVKVETFIAETDNSNINSDTNGEAGDSNVNGNDNEDVNENSKVNDNDDNSHNGNDDNNNNNDDNSESGESGNDENGDNSNNDG